jgi:hydrogenase/urease accessory protein HupE
MKRLCLTLLICIAFVGVAPAHDPGLSTVVVKVADNRLEVSATFSRKDIEGLLALQRGAALDQTALAHSPAIPKGLCPPAQGCEERATLGRGLEMNSSTPRGLCQFPADFEAVLIKQNGQALHPMAHRIDFPGADNVEAHLTFNSDATGKLTFRSPLLERFAPGHRQLLSVIDSNGRALAERLLSAGVNSADLEIQPAHPRVPETSIRGFVLLGVEHILAGYDHLLFLFALLIVARNFMASLKVITCFTVAHSITLVLATFDVVQLPARIVEPLIAASIVYVSIENLVRRGEPRGRLALTFGFGLVHGLGFATVLRELGLGSSGSGIAFPLLSFNLGVELGQILVAAILLPLIWKLRQHPSAANRLAPACSLLITAVGTYWLIQRLWSS